MRVIASQKLPRDIGESIFAARHQDVSQGPLGSLGQKSCRTKVSRFFRIFVPDFAPNFALNFPRIFRGLFVLRFVGDGDQKKFTRNPRHFSMQNSQANTKKIFTKLFLWRAGKVKKVKNESLEKTLRVKNRLRRLIFVSSCRENESVYLHCSGPLLKNGLDIAMADMVLLIFTACPYLL